MLRIKIALLLVKIVKKLVIKRLPLNTVGLIDELEWTLDDYKNHTEPVDKDLVKLLLVLAVLLGLVGIGIVRFCLY